MSKKILPLQKIIFQLRILPLTKTFNIKNGNPFQDCQIIMVLNLQTKPKCVWFFIQ